MLTCKQLHKRAYDALDSAKWLGALGGGAPLHQFERCSLLIRDLADGLIACIGCMHGATDLTRAAQLVVQAQHALTRSRIVDPDDRVGEVVACESFLGEACDIVGRARASERVDYDTLAPAGL